MEPRCAGDGTRQFNVFQELPWEHVWFDWILRRLTMKDLFNFRTVSKEAHDLVQEYFKYNFRLDLSFVGGKFDSKAFLIVTENVQLFRELILKNTKDFLNDNLLLPVLMNNSQLRKVDFTGCNSISNTALQALASHCPELEELCLWNCHWVSREGLISVAIQCQQLKRLDLTGCWDIGDDTIMTMVMICKNLTNLNLANIYGLTDQAVIAIAKSGCKFEQLCLKGCWRVTNKAVRILAEYCQTLRGLQVRECRNITEDSLSLIREKHIKLDIPAKLDRKRKALIRLNMQI